jgi:protein CpxP
MRPWFKRSLFGFAGLALAAASLGGCANHRERDWQGNSAEFRAKMVERVGSKLELDAQQKQKLAVLADKLQAQREAMRGGSLPGASWTRPVPPSWSTKRPPQCAAAAPR